MQNNGKRILRERKAKRNRNELLLSVLLGLGLGASVWCGYLLSTI